MYLDLLHGGKFMKGRKYIACNRIASTIQGIHFSLNSFLLQLL
jgi:hypothetical protein